MDAIVIGAGPAGISAALYLARAGIKTAVIGSLDKTRLSKAHLVQNYFGAGEKSGAELLKTGKQQAEKFEAKFIEGEVVSVEKTKDGFETETSSEKFRAKAIIIATGASMKSSIKGEKEFLGKGVSQCVACDGPFFKNKKVAVIGSGDFAEKEAKELQSFTKHVKIIESQKIREIFGKKFIEGIVYKDGKRENFDGIFIAGELASAGNLASMLGVPVKDGFIVIDKNCATVVPGVFAAGDCTGGIMQVAKAVGEGAVAAINAIAYIKGEKPKQQWGGL
jgi:thioredoxin reductase (NADPH)